MRLKSNSGASCWPREEVWEVKFTGFSPRSREAVPIDPVVYRLPTPHVSCFCELRAIVSKKTVRLRTIPFTYSPITSNSQCELSGAAVVWGCHFMADAALVSVVAGLNGQVRPDLIEGQVFTQNALLAGMFLMGTVDESPINESVARAQVRAH